MLSDRHAPILLTLQTPMAGGRLREPTPPPTSQPDNVEDPPGSPPPAPLNFGKWSQTVADDLGNKLAGFDFAKLTEMCDTATNQESINLVARNFTGIVINAAIKVKACKKPRKPGKF